MKNQHPTALSAEVVNHPAKFITLKSILHALLAHDLRATEKCINETIINHPLVDKASTEVLIIREKTTGTLSLPLKDL